MASESSSRAGHDFLMRMYFKSHLGDWDSYISRAYLDMSRTLHHFSECAKKDILKGAAVSILKAALSKLAKNGDSASRTAFDKWHARTCERLLEVFPPSKRSDDFEFHYGQAQKWLNMTIKYSWLFPNGKRLEGWYAFAHFPIDEYILRAAKKRHLLRPNISWSRWDQATYSDFQNKLTLSLGTHSDPLAVEHEWWLQEWAEENKRPL